MSDTTATSFDAIKTANDLRAEGIEPGQANAIAQGMNQASAAAVVDAITALDAKIDTAMAQMQVRLTTTLITAMGIFTGIFSAITITAIRYMLPG